MARTMDEYVDHLDEVPALILPCMVRFLMRSAPPPEKDPCPALGAVVNGPSRATQGFAGGTSCG